MIASTVLWLLVVGLGSYELLTYSNRSGRAAHPPASWPAASGLARDAETSTLVMAVHPKCSCTRSSVRELARLMARVGEGRLRVHVVFVRLAGFEAGWEKSDLWHDVARLPGATAHSDDGGRIAELFGAATSGQVVLYGAGGRLKFHGGITASRGHEGDNAGARAIQELVRVGGAAEDDATPVFGCSLSDTKPCCAER